MVVSGEGGITLTPRRAELYATPTVDGAYIDFSSLRGPRTLPSDVVVVQREQPRQERQGAPPMEVVLKVDARLGQRFYIRGAGLEARLAGGVAVSGRPTQLQAVGNVRIVDGVYNGYGQRLQIQRGLVTFSGPLGNPALNVLAVRSGLPVEVGVLITGTALAPIVQLHSDVAMSDVERLNWLVLGRPPGAGEGQEAAMLTAAASAIFAGQSGGAASNIMRSLGIDEFGVRSGYQGGSSILPAKRWPHAAPGQFQFGRRRIRGAWKADQRPAARDVRTGAERIRLLRRAELPAHASAFDHCTARAAPTRSTWSTRSRSTERGTARRPSRAQACAQAGSGAGPVAAPRASVARGTPRIQRRQEEQRQRRGDDQSAHDRDGHRTPEHAARQRDHREHGGGGRQHDRTEAPHRRFDDRVPRRDPRRAVALDLVDQDHRVADDHAEQREHAELRDEAERRPEQEQRRGRADEAQRTGQEHEQRARERMQLQHQQREHDEEHQGDVDGDRLAGLRRLLGCAPDVDAVANGSVARNAASSDSICAVTVGPCTPSFTSLCTVMV